MADEEHHRPTVRLVAYSKAGLAYCTGALFALYQLDRLRGVRAFVGAGLGNLPVLLLRRLHERYDGHQYHQESGALEAHVLGPLHTFLLQSQNPMHSPYTCLEYMARWLFDPAPRVTHHASVVAELLRDAEGRHPRVEPLPPKNRKSRALAMMPGQQLRAQHFVLTGTVRATQTPTVVTTDRVCRPRAERQPSLEGRRRGPPQITLQMEAPGTDPVLFAAVTSLRTGSEGEPQATVDSSLYSDVYASKAGAVYGEPRDDLLIDGASQDPRVAALTLDTAQPETAYADVLEFGFDLEAEGVHRGLGRLPLVTLAGAANQGFLDAWGKLRPDAPVPTELMYDLGEDGGAG